MRNVFLLETTTEVLSEDSYVLSYPHLLNYFAGKEVIEPGDVVRGAHMVYGWMPTILELYPEPGENDLPTAAGILTKAKDGATLAATELDALASLVNNSLVGASKLLHFVAPSKYAIWDSKVYSFVHEKRPHNYRVNNVAAYIEYLELLRHLATEVEFPPFHASVQAKLGYQVSPMRSLELVMFLNAPVYGG
jgi:hypothetical protein